MAWDGPNYRCPKCSWVGDAPLAWNFKLICPSCANAPMLSTPEAEVIDRRVEEIERLQTLLHDAASRVGEWIDKVVIPNWEMIRALHAMLNPAPVDSVTTTGQPVPAETYPQGDGKAGGDYWTCPRCGVRFLNHSGVQDRHGSQCTVPLPGEERHDWSQQKLPKSGGDPAVPPCYDPRKPPGGDQ